MEQEGGMIFSDAIPCAIIVGKERIQPFHEVNMAERRSTTAKLKPRAGRLLTAVRPLPVIAVSAYHLPEGTHSDLASEQFCAPDMVVMLRDCAHGLVEAEGPMTGDFLEKRLISHFGISKRGRFIAAQLEKVFEDFSSPATVQKGNDGKKQMVYWPDSYASIITEKGEGYRECRCSEEDAPDKRYTYELPLVEVANAMAASVKDGERISRDELFTRAARLMGYTRIGASLRPVLERALKLARELKYFK